MVGEQRDRVVADRAAEQVFVARDLADRGELVCDGLKRGVLVAIHSWHAELDRVAAAEDCGVAATLASEPREALFRVGIHAAGRAAAGGAKLVEIQLPYLIVP